MHAVIPVAEEPVNLSLPYALASIREHTDLIPVTIGYDTGLCDLHIPTRQERGQRFQNTDLAMRTACETSWISDPFVWTADDIYWLHPAPPVRWAIGLLDAAKPGTTYGNRKHATARHLRTLNLPTFDYESHTPLPVYRTSMLTVLDIIRDNPGLEKRSLYGNLTGQPDIIQPDVKLRSRTAPTPDGPWVSTEGNPARYLNLHLP